jgi:hypothetical protein
LKLFSDSLRASGIIGEEFSLGMGLYIWKVDLWIVRSGWKSIFGEWGSGIRSELSLMLLFLEITGLLWLSKK